ncbi:MAG TPA: protease pro-enzyme activation domain-containing protein, partial [Pseudonocardiaceae bacterium]|nr:protease pro-enzyme activation domain-containing protein [Pseudonocardiaceae bacterium]
TATGTVPSTQQLTIQLWLQANVAGATAYANSVSDPHNANFHHYLSPDAYSAKFGPSTASTNAVESWLNQQGFTNVTADAQRNYVRATAPVSTIQNALRVQMKTYKFAGQAAQVTSNDRDVTLPASIAGDVSGISGLNNLQPTTGHTPVPTPAQIAAEADNCSAYYGQHTQTGLPALNGNTSFPTHVCGYTATQLRGAYGMTNANTGKGVTVAYVEDGTPYKMFQTLTTWAAANGMPAPRSANYQELAIGNGDACGNPFDGEEQLDIEAGYAMAPDAHQLLIGGDSCAQQGEGIQALLDADLAVVNGNGGHPLASIASNSWGLTGGEASLPAEYLNLAHSILLRAAAEGVGMYFCSQDAPSVAVPSDDPFAIAVGGTSLAINANNQRTFETGWSNDVQEVDTATNGYDDLGIQRWAAGGGASQLWAQPAYQKGIVPASLSTPAAGDKTVPARAVPDIAAVADLTTGITQSDTEPGQNGAPDVFTTFVDGGTSLATPLVAGMVADAEQGQATPFGFSDPLIYSLAGSSALNDVKPVTASTPAQYQGVYCADQACIGVPSSVWTFDGQSKDYTDQVTAAGYDTMTGLGSPNGQAFINALRKSAK